MFCNCLISSSAIKIFSSMFFILISSLSKFEQRKNSKPFLIYCFCDCYVIAFI
ncbi:glycosyl transferase family 2 [Streptococcus suis]|nr:glycosyl transferase family 2 [Streptococcus suis]